MKSHTMKFNVMVVVGVVVALCTGGIVAQDTLCNYFSTSGLPCVPDEELFLLPAINGAQPCRPAPSTCKVEVEGVCTSVACTGYVPISQITWVMGAMGESCNDACAPTGIGCNPTALEQITTASLVEAIGTIVGATCNPMNTLEGFVTTSPDYYEVEQTCYYRPSVGTAADCSQTNASTRRFCCCANTDECLAVLPIMV